MPRYSISTITIDEDDPPAGLHRIGGPALGLPSERWPRHRGRCMQHAFTIDLAGIELTIPKAKGMRSVSVFLESFYEQDQGAEGIAVVWLSQADVDAYPETEPPPDFVADLLTHAMQSTGFELELLGEDDQPSDGDSYLGGEPTWSDAGAPERAPAGAFVLQISSWNVPFTSHGGQLFVFEDGGYIQLEDDAPVPWPEAIVRSRRIVVLDQPVHAVEPDSECSASPPRSDTLASLGPYGPTRRLLPAADALQKWGGVPRGVREYDWPSGASHLFTYVPPEWPEGEEGVAIAVFGRLSKTTNWDHQPSFFHTVTITEDSLADSDPDLEIPEDLPRLDERALELRPFPADTSWRELQAGSFVGPRAAWRDPSSRNARVLEGPVLQLASDLLPNAPGRGSLYFSPGVYPWWMPEPGAPQATEQPYQPSGTLGDETTSAAVVVGYRIDFDEFALLPERVEALERALDANLRARSVELKLFVPGDTCTDPDNAIQAKFVLGRAVVITEADDYEPSPVDPQEVANALAELPALDPEFWQAALENFSDATPSDAPAVHLMSWGPLCYAGLYVGVPRTRDDSDPPVHKYVANQDMSQEWSEEGIDGVHIESGEFSDIVELSLAPEQDLAKAAPLEGARYWLICRYD